MNKKSLQLLNCEYKIFSRSSGARKIIIAFYIFRVTNRFPICSHVIEHGTQKATAQLNVTTV
jgi:hypothetical protein